MSRNSRISSHRMSRALVNWVRTLLLRTMRLQVSNETCSTSWNVAECLDLVQYCHRYSTGFSIKNKSSREKTRNFCLKIFSYSLEKMGQVDWLEHGPNFCQFSLVLNKIIWIEKKNFELGAKFRSTYSHFV